jgi:epoxyqueuosine reductase
MTGHSLSERLKAQAYGFGFDLAGIVALGEPETRAHFDAWLANNRHGAMAYLDGDGAELRRDTRRPHAGATHALVLAMSYGGREPSGPIARYARGDDYHELLRERVRELHLWLQREVGHDINARPYVDSGPILERDLAQRAGLGWFGKNTMLISPKIGSFFFLASLFVEFPLEPDDPFTADRCGTCTRCLDACPTDAFVGPRDLDATKCISYLTIELRGEIPVALREQMGALVFGCDICQDVCPWNVRFATELQEPAFAARAFVAGANARSMARDILHMTPESYATAFRGSAIKRAKLWMLTRNACVVLGNVGTTQDLPLLETMQANESEIVRSHATWARDQITARAAH